MNNERFKIENETEIIDTITGYLIFRVLNKPPVWRIVKAKGHFAEFEGSLKQCKAYVKRTLVSA